MVLFFTKSFLFFFFCLFEMLDIYTNYFAIVPFEVLRLSDYTNSKSKKKKDKKKQ